MWAIHILCINQIQMCLYPAISAPSNTQVSVVRGRDLRGKCAEQSCQRLWTYLFLLLYAYVDIYKANWEWRRVVGVSACANNFCIYDPSANAMDDKVLPSKNKIFRSEPSTIQPPYPTHRPPPLHPGENHKPNTVKTFKQIKQWS